MMVFDTWRDAVSYGIARAQLTGRRHRVRQDPIAYRTWLVREVGR